MTVYYIREGKLVEAATLQEARDDKRSIFPRPNVSRFTPMESPVTGKTISSWRQRDADMAAVGAVDPRDLSGIPFQKRAEQNARQQQLSDDDTFQWGAKSSD